MIRGNENNDDGNGDTVVNCGSDDGDNDGDGCGDGGRDGNGNGVM